MLINFKVEKLSALTVLIIIIGIFVLLYYGLNYLRTHIREGRYEYTEKSAPVENGPGQIERKHILQINEDTEFIYSMNSDNETIRVRGNYVRNVDGTVDFYSNQNIEEDDTKPSIWLDENQHLFEFSKTDKPGSFTVEWDKISGLNNDLGNKTFVFYGN